MLIKKVFPRTVPYVMAAAMAAGVGVTGLKAAQDDSFTKIGPKVETVKPEVDEVKRGFPWLSVLGGACILAFLGLVKLSDRIDKKLDAEEAAKSAGKPDNADEDNTINSEE